MSAIAAPADATACPSIAITLDAIAAMPHHPHMGSKRITVVETSIFTRRVEKLLSAEEREALVDYLAANPEAGDVMEELGGIRKVRFAAKGRGKSGGVRVIYFFHTENTPLYALTVYAKNEKADLSGEDRKAMRAFVEAIKASWKHRR